MAGGKATPRQKMINMMYLVLTALLAMNVSKEVLLSFITVNDGLETTKLALNDKMSSTYGTFEQYYNDSPEKYGEAWNGAKVFRDEANALISYIDNLKAMTIAGTDKLEMDQVIGKDASGQDTVLSLNYVSSKDNYDVNTEMLVGSEPATPKEGENTAVELQQKLESFRDKVKAAIGQDNPVLTANVDKVFNFESKMKDGVEETWISKNFYHVPLVASTTIMSGIQSDIRNIENEVVNWMLGDVEGASFKFNTLAAIVKPKSSYVTVGSKYEAEIFLGAYDNQNSPTVYICGPGARLDTLKKEIIGEKIKLDNVGSKAQLNVAATGAGVKTVEGIIEFTPVGGEKQIELFSTSYEVAAPNLVVSPTKMNVFYRGVDNPVEVSVAGYSDKDLTASMTNGSLRKSPKGGYIVKPGKGKVANINVSATNPDGSKKSFKSIDFRCKNVPSPEPFFAGKTITDNTVPMTQLKATQGVIAKMKDFEFDLKFTVTGFKLVTVVGGTPIEKISKSNRLTSEMKTILSKVRRGQKVWIEGIKAKGPDGTIRKLGNLALKAT